MTSYTGPKLSCQANRFCDHDCLSLLGQRTGRNHDCLPKQSLANFFGNKSAPLKFLAAASPGHFLQIFQAGTERTCRGCSCQFNFNLAASLESKYHSKTAKTRQLSFCGCLRIVFLCILHSCKGNTLSEGRCTKNDHKLTIHVWWRCLHILKSYNQTSVASSIEFLQFRTTSERGA